MDILFLGYSNLVKRRLLPVLDSRLWHRVHLAKFAPQQWDDEWQACPVPVTRYDNYEAALAAVDSGVAWVSTVNSAHVEWAGRALRRGLHTVVDKPATTTLDEARDLVAEARRRDRLLAEATVYLTHPQWDALDRVMRDNGDEPRMASVLFTMPPFTPDNFRYSKAAGGGAVMDTAPYAVSVGRRLFGTLPERVEVVIDARTPEVDTQYSLLMAYPGGRALTGHFGFTTEYANRLTVLGHRTNVTMNRVFTIPDDLAGTLAVRHLNQNETVTVPPANNFANYLALIARAIAARDHEPHYRALLDDAAARQMITDNIKPTTTT